MAMPTERSGSVFSFPCSISTGKPPQFLIGQACGDVKQPWFLIGPARGDVKLPWFLIGQACGDVSGQASREVSYLSLSVFGQAHR